MNSPDAGPDAGPDADAPDATDAAVELERSGGFAGISRTVRVPRAEVPDELAETLERALAAPPAPPVPPERAERRGGADRFTYVLRHEGQQVQLGESDLDPETHQLVSWLMARCAKRS